MGLSRATDAAGIRDRLDRFSTEEGRRRARAFRPEPSDVIIVTYPKCGTTLLQQIVHGLRTCGDMQFSEITEVVPWIELAHDLGLDLDDPGHPRPRAFKSHAARGEIAGGARYIYVTRDPVDVLVSFFHFFEDWLFERGALDVEAFAMDFLLGGSASGTYWAHLASWWPALGTPGTLFLAFEDVVADLAGAVARVEAFLGLEPSAARREVATAHASLDFMRAHVDQFDDHLVRRARNAAMGLPADAVTSKVRRGAAGGQEDQLTRRVADAWEQQWREVVVPVTGCATYAELRYQVARRG